MIGWGEKALFLRWLAPSAVLSLGNFLHLIGNPFIIIIRSCSDSRLLRRRVLAYLGPGVSQGPGFVRLYYLTDPYISRPGSCHYYQPLPLPLPCENSLIRARARGGGGGGMRFRLRQTVDLGFDPEKLPVARRSVLNSLKLTCRRRRRMNGTKNQIPPRGLHV